MELLPKVFWKMHSHHSSLRKTNSEFTLKIDQGPREGNDDVISQPSGQILATSHDLTPNGGEKQGQFLYFRETQVGEIFLAPSASPAVTPPPNHGMFVGSNGSKPDRWMYFCM